MVPIRVISDGTARGTRIEGLGDAMVKDVYIFLTPETEPTAHIEILMPQVDIKGEFDVTEVCPHCGAKKKKQ